jgi:hypothetical protein
MTDRLKSSILEALINKTGKTADKIRPRLSELRRKHSGLTMNAAAQMYAQAQGTSIMAKLDPADRQALAAVQSVTQVSVSSVSRVDKRTLNINNSPIHNLSFGDRNTLSQSVVALDDHLEQLLRKLDHSTALKVEEKADYKSDIQTIASQIGKSKPSASIIKTAWKSVQALADIEGFAQLIGRISPLIQGFIS